MESRDHGGAKHVERPLSTPPCDMLGRWYCLSPEPSLIEGDMPESVQKDACQRTRSLSSHREELLTKIRAGRVRPLANFQGKLTPRHAVAGGSAGCRLKKSCEGVLLDVPRASPCSYLSSKACLAPLPRRRKSSNILGRQQGLNAPQGIQRILLPGSLPPGSGQGASKKAQLEHGARARLEAQLAHGRELRMETA